MSMTVPQLESTLEDQEGKSIDHLYIAALDLEVHDLTFLVTDIFVIMTSLQPCTYRAYGRS